jgi:putative intracellular protease/amidase
MKHAVIVVTSHSDLGQTGRKTGYFLSEVSHPCRILAEAGMEITFASPRGGKAPVDERSIDMSDLDNRWLLDHARYAAMLENTRPLGEVLAKEVDVIFFAGGHGAMWDFPDDRDVIRLSQAVIEKGGIVAAVCHGSSALLNVKDKEGHYLVSGAKVTGFTNLEETMVELDTVVPFLLESKLKERGADFESETIWQPHVTVDQRLITGQNPASARGVAQAIVAVSGGVSHQVHPADFT